MPGHVKIKDLYSGPLVVFSGQPNPKKEEEKLPEQVLFLGGIESKTFLPNALNWFHEAPFPKCGLLADPRRVDTVLWRHWTPCAMHWSDLAIHS